MASKYLTSPPDSTRMPGGIPYIVGNEAAERFSFYGMKAILTIFMTEHLLSQSGSLDTMSGEQAKSCMHLFVAAAYLFPLAGSILADAFLGKYRTILILSIVYCVGHLALALDETRLGLGIGLTLIAVGSGGIKPCVSAHVGDQFGKRNQNLLSKVFGWFYFAINLGAFSSSLLTPILLAEFGPGVAFGVPGVLMAIATFVFWVGRNKFVHIPAGGKEFVNETFSNEGIGAILRLIPLYLFIAMFWALFDQTASSWVLQAKHMDRQFGIEWLPSQIQAANPILIMLFIPLFAYVIYPLLGRVVTLTPLRKVAIGLFVTVIAFGISARIEMQLSGGSIISCTSEGDSGQRPVENLIDGTEDNPGWVSIELDDHEGHTPEPNTAEGSEGRSPAAFPQEAVIQLRERKAWTISSVRLNPAVELDDFLNDKLLERSPEGTLFARLGRLVTGEEPMISRPSVQMSRRCWAKKVEVLVGDKRKGPWKSVGRVEFERRDRERTIEFAPIEAQFVVIRIKSNWGGRFVALRGVEVISPNTLPTDAHAAAADVWPDVAAIGHQPNIVWQLLAYVILTAAEIMVSITCLEFSYTQAPKKMKSLIMALYLASVGLGNLFTSLVNRVIANEDGSSKLPGASYYWFFTAAMLLTAIGFLFFVRSYRGKTYIQGDD